MQNLRLDELTRFDALTGLESRGHWQQQVEALLARTTRPRRASMLLVDVDLFRTSTTAMAVPAATTSARHRRGDPRRDTRRQPRRPGRRRQFAIMVPVRAGRLHRRIGERIPPAWMRSSSSDSRRCAARSASASPPKLRAMPACAAGWKPPTSRRCIARQGRGTQSRRGPSRPPALAEP